MHFNVLDCIPTDHFDRIITMPVNTNSLYFLNPHTTVETYSVATLLSSTNDDISRVTYSNSAVNYALSSKAVISTLISIFFELVT